MRKLSTILLAVALVLGLAQCKKEQPATPQSEGNVVTITLNVGDNNGSRVNVDPTGNQVTFTDGDQILVASGGKYVGTLTKNGTTFSGNVSEADLVENQPLYFYFLGKYYIHDDISYIYFLSLFECKQLLLYTRT